MENRTSYQYKDSAVIVMRSRYKVLSDNERHCYLCDEKLQNNDSFVFTCNNHKFIPNVPMHETCFEKADPQEVFTKIEADWTAYKRLSKFF